MSARKRRGEKTLADDLQSISEKIDVWANHKCDAEPCNCLEVIESANKFCEREGYSEDTAKALGEIVAIFGARATGWRKAKPKEEDEE